MLTVPSGQMSSGCSSHRLATIVANLRPADLTNEEGVAYDMTNALLKGGVLSPVIWESALAAFGKEGTREDRLIWWDITASFP